MKRRLTALLLVLLCLPLTACQKQQNLYSATWFDLFDTVAIVQGYADSQDSWNAQTQAMYSDLQRYNELFDIYHHYDGVINLYDVNARPPLRRCRSATSCTHFCAGAKTPLTLPPTARRTSPQVRCCACGTMRGKRLCPARRGRHRGGAGAYRRRGSGSGRCSTNRLFC